MYISDINDECPSFEEHLYTGQVTPQDKFVLESGTVDRLVLTGLDMDSVSTMLMIIHVVQF